MDSPHAAPRKTVPAPKRAVPTRRNDRSVASCRSPNSSPSLRRSRRFPADADAAAAGRRSASAGPGLEGTTATSRRQRRGSDGGGSADGDLIIPSTRSRSLAGLEWAGLGRAVAGRVGPDRAALFAPAPAQPVLGGGGGGRGRAGEGRGPGSAAVGLSSTVRIDLRSCYGLPFRLSLTDGAAVADRRGPRGLAFSCLRPRCPRSQPARDGEVERTRRPVAEDGAAVAGSQTQSRGARAWRGDPSRGGGTAEAGTTTPPPLLGGPGPERPRPSLPVQASRAGPCREPTEGLERRPFRSSKRRRGGVCCEERAIPTDARAHFSANPCAPRRFQAGAGQTGKSRYRRQGGA